MYLIDPTFQLFSAHLDETVNEWEKQKELYTALRADRLIVQSGIEIPNESIPVALRWTLHPKWGFPRKPFKVYRRKPNYTEKDLQYIIQEKAEPVCIRKAIDFSDNFYMIVVTCAVPVGQSLILTPIGNNDVLMKAKEYKIKEEPGRQESNEYFMESVLFKSPFMTGILCEGMGSVISIAGVKMQQALKAEDWEHIQEVGLPFEKDLVGGQGYHGDKQGVVGHLTDAASAALTRLKLGEKLFQVPPSVHEIHPQYLDLFWQYPNPSKYLKYLKDDQLNLIKKCLENSNDFINSKRQALYRETREIDGLHQSEENVDTKAEVDIPVVGQTMLSVAHESPASLGLGFGTYDFPEFNLGRYFKYRSVPLSLKPSQVLTDPIYTGTEYMVVAEYSINPDKRNPKELWSPFLSKSFNRIIRKKNDHNPLVYNDKPTIYKSVIHQNLRRFPKKLKLTKNEIQGLQILKWPTVAFAALNNEKPAPVKPEQLEAIGIRINRPEKMDMPWTQAVKIRWPKSAITQGSAFAGGYEPNTKPLVLNDNYPFNKASYHNLLTPVQKQGATVQDDQDIGKSIISATEEPVPIFGSEKHHYFVSALDVFGRWSNWGTVPFTTKALPPQQPGIMSMKLDLSPGTQSELLEADAQSIPFQLEIEFGWDWADRSPSAVQLAGKFFNAGLKNPSGGTPNYFSLQNDDVSTPIITIKFDQNNPENKPYTQSPYKIVIVKQSESSSSENTSSYGQDTPSNELVRYKLIIPNIKCDFPNGQPYKVAYAAYIRGLERIREPINEYSDWNPWDNNTEGQQRKKNYIARFDDPRPPAVSVLQANVQFTALSDVSNVARGELSWPSATNALGYHVWEANEIGIRTALKKILEEIDGPLLPLKAPFVERATQLEKLLKGVKYLEACQKYFSRLTKETLTTPKFELSLPGSSDVLSLYRVSSVNSANIESKKSNISFFAVPRLNVPNPPMLQVRKHKDSEGKLDGFLLKTVHISGKKPAGYRVFRVRKEYLADKVGMMGLPVYLETNSHWKDAAISLIDGITYQGKQIIDKGLKPSWRPFVYQAVAVGKEDQDEGLFSGVSEGSPSEITYLPPENAPSLEQVGPSQHNQFSRCFEVKTSAPFHTLDLGKTIINIYELDDTMKRKHLGAFTAQESKIDTGLSLASTEEKAKKLPLLELKSENIKTELVNFRICVPGKNARIIIRITDPFGHFSEIELKKLN